MTAASTVLSWYETTARIFSERSLGEMNAEVTHILESMTDAYCALDVQTDTTGCATKDAEQKFRVLL